MLTQKMQLIQQLAGRLSFGIREDGYYYVITQHMVEIGGDGVLTSLTQSASTPEEAATQWWEQHVTDLPEDRYLVLYYGGEQHHFLWAGKRWAELKQDD